MKGSPSRSHRPAALGRLRLSASALCLAAVAWTAGCATPRPMIEPSFAQRSYTPARIALLPPAVFMVLDQFGDNDPRRSWELGQAVTQQTVGLLTEELRRRGYDLDLQARWDGIFDGSGQLLVPSSELGWLANSIVQFANSEAGGGQGPMETPAFVAPELARKVGWATQSDALLYVNMKGVSVTQGKRTAQIIGTVFIVVVVAAIIAMILGQGREGGGSRAPSTGGGGSGRGVPNAGNPAAAGGAMAVAPAGGAGRPTSAVVAPPVGRGSYGAGRGGGQVYRSRPRSSSGLNLGVGVMVPLGGHEHTHEGQVADQDDFYAGDEIQVSLTLVSAHDGRVLWHIRDSVDVDPAKPHELQEFVRRYVGLMPQSLAPGPAAAPAAPGSP
jgi:hypothetical protein